MALDMKLRLYSAIGANCCERVRWVMDYKAARYELIELDSLVGDQPFSENSPFGRVPLLLIDEQAITESMAIAELMEELIPTPNLLGDSPIQRARVREICEAINSSIHPVQNSSVVRYFHPNMTKEAMRPLRAKWIVCNLDKLRGRLWQSSSFAIGNSFTLADIFIAVMCKKAIALGAAPESLSAYGAHWQYLMSVDSIRASCPIGNLE